MNKNIIAQLDDSHATRGKVPFNLGEILRPDEKLDNLHENDWGLYNGKYTLNDLLRFKENFIQFNSDYLKKRGWLISALDELHADIKSKVVNGVYSPAELKKIKDGFSRCSENFFHEFAKLISGQ